MKKPFVLSVAVAAASLIGCASTARAEAGDPSHAPQELTPPRQIEMYLDGYHIYKSDMNQPPEKQLQFRAAHYCSHWSPELFMCSVYEGNGPKAKLVAIEYVVPDPVYQKLSAGEKKYWHPHNVEVSSGLLRMPGLPGDKEKATLEFLSTTWGKTWNLWQPGDSLPIGEPKLLWSIGDGKANDATKKSVAQRDKDFHY